MEHNGTIASAFSSQRRSLRKLQVEDGDVMRIANQH